MKLKRQNQNRNSSNRAPSVLSSGEDKFYYSSKHIKKREAEKNAEKIRRRGFRVRNKYLTIGNQKMHIVYQGSRRGKGVRSFNKKR